LTLTIGSHHGWEPHSPVRGEWVCTGQYHDVVVFQRSHRIESNPATRSLDYQARVSFVNDA
jgi:hypothetical protein